MGNYEKLEVWKVAMDIAELSIRIADSMIGPSRYALGDQVRRSAISIPSNLAEGAGRGSKRDFARFTRYALGSLYELQTQLMLAKRVGALALESSKTLHSLRRLRGMLHSLLRTLETS